MEFLIRLLYAVVVLLGLYGLCGVLHEAGEAYFTHRLIQNAKRHQDWLEFKRCHR